MRHTAIRLIPCAINGVIHVNNVTDPALKRLVKDRRLQPLIRRALKDIGQQYELLIPYAVDDAELQLKRYIQYKLGTTVNMSELRTEYQKYYQQVCSYGSPAEVLQGWGLDVTYNRRLTEDELKEQVGDKAVDGVVWKLGRNSQLYQHLANHARRQGLTVGGLIEKMGYIYRGGNSDDGEQNTREV